jgi:oxygen-dependent protoporphyrinogen oxidase
MRSAFPRLAALEAQHGSVLRGLRAARRQGAGMGRSLSFPDGVEELPRALAARLGARLVTARVRELRREGAGWTLALEGGGAPSAQADAVVMALAPRATADLLAPIAAGAATALRQIPLASLGVVCLGFKRRDVGMALGAYGFLVARGERPTLLGCQYESTVFPGRAPERAVLLRALLGGAFDPAAVDQSEAALIARTVADLKVAAGLKADPDFTAVWRMRQVLPQYELGHSRRVATVDEEVARLPGLHVLGIALRGVGMTDCIRAASGLAASFSAAGP